MTTIKCPHCNQTFTLEENSILSKLRDEEFDSEVRKKISEAEEHLTSKHLIEVQKAVLEQRQISDKNEAKLQEEITRLKGELATAQATVSVKEMEAANAAKQEMQNRVSELELSLSRADSNLELSVLKAEQKLKEEYEKKLSDTKTCYEERLADTQVELDYYKNLKAKLSTKMVGESLEVHCSTEFEKLRATAFRNAYFDKDNVVSKTGSKGDFIFRDYDEDGSEIVSIMFEMKNEMETTATKHKNEDFLRELDKDRKEKGCEYAVLVTLLEADSELYNTGIVDMSHKFEKMYVIRPQFFIPIITLIRNAAMNALENKRELIRVRSQNLDVTHFEEDLEKFKGAFSYNYQQASKRFHEAIDEIDKSIDHLQKIKDALTASDRQLRLANNKAEDLTIKKLCRNNETLTRLIEEARNNRENEGENKDVVDD